MRHSSSLHELIRSLTKAEKRHFRLYTSTHVVGDGNTYLDLFDAIGKLKAYDEKKFIRSHAGSDFLVHLPERKYYLYNLLLESLHVFHSDSSVFTKINRLLHYAEVLYNKALLGQCRKILSKAKKLAYRYEKYAKILEILWWEARMVIGGANSMAARVALIALMKEWKAALAMLHNTGQYTELNMHLHTFLKQEGTVRSKEEIDAATKVLNNALLKDDRRAQTFDSRYNFYDTNMLYHSIRLDTGKAFEYGRKMMQFLEEHPHQHEDNIEDYLVSLSNFCEISRRYGDYDTFWKTFRKIETIKPGSVKEESVHFFVMHLDQFAMHTGTGEFEKAVDIISRGFEDRLQYHREHLTSERVARLMIYTVISLFGAARYHDALQWINRILNDTALQTRKDVLSAARTFNLIVHYELGNELLLESQVKSTHRYLYKLRRLYPTEAALLVFIRNIIRSKDRGEVMNELTALQVKLRDILKDSREQQIFYLLDPLAWVESKIQKVSYASLMKKNTKKRLMEMRKKQAIGS